MFSKNHHWTRKHDSWCPLFYRTAVYTVLDCMRFSRNLGVPSISAAPENCVSQYLEKPDFDRRHLHSLLSVKTTSRGLHPFPRSEGASKAVFADTNIEVIQDGVPHSCLSLLHAGPPTSHLLCFPLNMFYNDERGEREAHRQAHLPQPCHKPAPLDWRKLDHAQLCPTRDSKSARKSILNINSFSFKFQISGNIYWNLFLSISTLKRIKCS